MTTPALEGDGSSPVESSPGQPGRRLEPKPPKGTGTLHIATQLRASPAHGDVPQPPRWAERTAHLIPLLTLPSGLWRIPLALGLSMGMLENGKPMHVTGAESAHVLSLSVVNEALALLSLGLVRRWGEVVPAWIPLVGGRRIPRLAVVIPAMTGALALTSIWVYATANLFVFVQPEFATGWWETLLGACYLPLLPWGPLLFALAVNYHRRHRTQIPVSSRRSSTDRRNEGRP